MPALQPTRMAGLKESPAWARVVERKSQKYDYKQNA
jgi:hypothetical protein